MITSSATPSLEEPATRGVSSWVAALEAATTSESMIAALDGLGATGDPQALPHLIRAFGFNRPAVAEVALTQVMKFGSTAVQPLLSLIDGYDYGARAYSVRALARLGDPAALDFLLEAVRSDFAPSVRRAALRGLGKVAGAVGLVVQEQVLPLLRAQLSDPDWGIRYAAVCAVADLKQVADPSLLPAIESIIQVALSDADPLIRVKTQISMSHEKDSSALW